VRSSASSRFPTNGYFQIPPKAAGLRVQMALIGSRHSDDLTMRYRNPAAHGHDP
jgi:hypothetical protein